LSWEEPEREMHRAAIWFLFDSEHAYFVLCFAAGIDAGKLRRSPGTVPTNPP